VNHDEVRLFGLKVQDASGAEAYFSPRPLMMQAAGN